MKKIRIYIIFTVVIWSCGTASKTTGSMSDAKLLDDMVAHKTFEIIVDRAYPQASSSMNAISNSGLLGPGNSIGRIDLAGDGNYLRVQGDSVAGYLPYYGERQFGGGYGSNDAIEFKGIPKKFEISRDDNSYQLQFNVNDQSESYTIMVLMYPNLVSRITVNSNQRTTIRYDGMISELKGKKDK
jgi:hypothetical protein